MRVDLGVPLEADYNNSPMFEFQVQNHTIGMDFKVFQGCCLFARRFFLFEPSCIRLLESKGKKRFTTC